MRVVKLNLHGSVRLVIREVLISWEKERISVRLVSLERKNCISKVESNRYNVPSSIAYDSKLFVVSNSRGSRIDLFRQKYRNSIT